MRKKGFTLIELLAVIVILAVIALITTPTILGVVEKARKSAFEDSVKIAANQVEYYLMSNNLSSVPPEGINVRNMEIRSDLKDGKFIESNGVIMAEFITNGSYCAFGDINNLIVYKNCADLDQTAPVIDESLITITKTSRSIYVKLNTDSVYDAESGISKIVVTVNKGGNKVESKTMSIGDGYTFDGLTTNTDYTVQVVATNGKDASSTWTSDVVKTTAIDAPTYSLNPETGWTEKVVVTITYPEGYTNEYSLDDGETWLPYTQPVEFTTNGTIIARSNDGQNYITGASKEIANVDHTAPVDVDFSSVSSYDSITIIASGKDDESDIYGYQFSIDGGAWTEISASNNHTFNDLESGSSHTFKVKVINNTYTTTNTLTTKNSADSAEKSVSVATVGNIDYSLAPNDSYAKKVVLTLTYPTGYTSSDGYVNQYSEDGGLTWTDYSGPIDITANEDVIAVVKDGEKLVKDRTITIDNVIDFTAKDIEFTNDGSGLESTNVEDAIIEIWGLLQ